MIEPPLVTFDAGQTLIDLDLDFLARRLAERGVTVGTAALAAAAPAAWRRYDALVDPAGGHPWRELMATLLRGAGVGEVAPLVDWLWDEQPRANLWRAQVPGMVALARELAARGVRVAVLSNSEGQLAELLAEIGVADAFARRDRLGPGRDREAGSPDLRSHARGARGAPAGHPHRRLVAGRHRGALGAGWRAIWFGRRTTAGRRSARRGRARRRRGARGARRLARR